MRRLVFIFLGLIIVASVLIAAGCTPKDVIARVNGKPITKPELDRAFTAAEQQFGSVFKGKEGKALKRQFEQRILDGLITQQVLLQTAQKKGIKVDNKQIDAEIKRITTQFGGEKKFKEQIKKLKLTEGQVREEIRNALVLQKLQEDFFKGAKVNSGDVTKYYNENKAQFQEPEQVHARHILVKDKKTADKVLAELKAGGKFEVLAKKYSKDDSNKNNGGDLGFFGRGQMVPEFEAVAFKLPKNTLSQPVKTEFGFHIIRVEGKKAASQRPLAEVRGEIEQGIKSQKFEEYIEEQRKDAKIVRYAPYNETTTTTPAPGQPGQPGQPGAEGGKDDNKRP